MNASTSRAALLPASAGVRTARLSSAAARTVLKTGRWRSGRRTASSGSASLSPEAAEAAQTLLPAVPLYRAVLRINRRLEPELRVMGDGYAKSEFRRTRSVTNPAHLIGFLSCVARSGLSADVSRQWKAYVDSIEIDPTMRTPPSRTMQELTEKMSPEQLGQLYELLTATRDAYTGESPPQDKPVESA